MPEAVLPAALAMLLFAAASYRFRRDSGVATPAQVRTVRATATLSLLLAWWMCGDGLAGERIVRFVICVCVAAVPATLLLSVAATTILAPLRHVLSHASRGLSQPHDR